MAKADKATAVADIAEQFKESTATVVTEYRGLTVSNLAELRRSLGDSATYTVAKNTLVKRAASEAGIEGSTSCSPVRPRSRSSRARRSTPPRRSRSSPRTTRRWSSRAATWTAARCRVAEVERIADLESREVLLAKLAGAMKANLAKAARPVQRTRVAGRPSGCRAAREEGQPKKPPKAPNQPH